MRFLIAAALFLTGCSAEYMAEARKRQAEHAARERAYLNSPEGIAFQGCQFRANAAMQGWRARSILDLEGTARSNQLMEQCMNYWRRTGQLP